MKTKKLENLDLLEITENTHQNRNTYPVQISQTLYNELRVRFGSLNIALEYALAQIKEDKENNEFLKEIDLD